MPSKIVKHRYGKTSIRLTKVTRHKDRHDLVELNVNVHLDGDFARSYTHGDNSLIVATDSMKNTVYVLAKSHAVDSPEAFAVHLAEHFTKKYKQVSGVIVEVLQTTWKRIEANGKAHPTAFVGGGDELRIGYANISPKEKVRIVQGGIKDLLVLKTTDSRFIGYVRDEFTTLPETLDRILATRLSATWTFKSAKPDYNTSFDRIQKAMLTEFANHKSDAVQQTLYDMGLMALKVEKSIRSIDLHMPNKHRVPFNLKPFGMEFQQDIFVTTDEPSGDISASIER